MWVRRGRLSMRCLGCCSHLVQAAEDSSRRVARVVSISSTAGRVARASAGVCALTRFGIVAFSQALRQSSSRNGTE